MFRSSVRLAIALLALSAVYAAAPARAVDRTAPEPSTPLTTIESAEIGLARYLTQIGAKIYGSETCPFTKLQRQLFGEIGFKHLNYIECSSSSNNAQISLCQAIRLQQTPTWEINGHIYQGVRSLDQLARLSHYSGATNFSQPQPNSD